MAAWPVPQAVGVAPRNHTMPRVLGRYRAALAEQLAPHPPVS